MSPARFETGREHCGPEHNLPHIPPALEKHIPADISILIGSPVSNSNKIRTDF